MGKRTCAICKIKKPEIEMHKSGIRVYCGAECGAKLAMETLKKNKKKQSAESDKKHRQKKKEFYRNDLSWQHKNTQPAFNKSRVMQELEWFGSRGIEPYCISCLKTKMDWCCGHYKTVGSSGNLRYNRSNTFLQCNRYCNMGKSGNISGDKNSIGYTKGIIHRFGDEEGGDILNYLDTEQHKVKKWCCDEVEETRMASLRIIKDLASKGVCR